MERLGRNAQVCFFRAEIYYRTRLAGEPILLSPEQVADTRAKIVSYGQTKPVPGEAE